MGNDLKIADDLDTAKSTAPTMASLVGGIIADAQELIKQQFKLLGSELRREFRQARTAAISLGIGVAITAVGALLLIVMLVHLLHAYTALPLWGCYGIVGGLLAVAGGGFLYFGGREASDVDLVPPPQTAEALKENLEWLANPTTSDRKQS